MAASPIIMMLLMFGVFWFILIRPQVKKQKEHAAMLQALQKGDMVITRGGMVGKMAVSRRSTRPGKWPKPSAISSGTIKRANRRGR